MARDYHRIATDLVEDLEGEIREIKELAEELKGIAETGTREDFIDYVDSLISDIEHRLTQF